MPRRSMRRALSAAAVLALSLPTARADAEGPARAIPLAEAIAHARAHHPEVRAALARLRAEQARAGVPSAQWLPRIGAAAELFGATANNTTGTYVSRGFDVPRIGSTRTTATGSWQPYAATFAGVGATQELFDFGRIAAERAAADALVDVERERARAEELTTAFDVQEAYFAVYAAKSVLRSSEEAHERSRVHRDLAKAGVDSGMRPPIELTRADAELARLDAGRVRARGGLAVARQVLAAAVGVEDPALDVVGDAPSPAELPSLSAAIQQATERSPGLREAIAELRAQEQRTRAIGADTRPDVSLTATLSGRAGGAPPSSGESAKGAGWIPDVPNWDVGVLFTWPLFDGVHDARRSASRAAEETRREEIVAARHGTITAVRNAYGAVVVAREVLPGLQRAVDAARANYAQADARFKSGLGTSVELADAEATRTDAEIQLALGVFQLARARAALGRIMAEDR